MNRVMITLVLRLYPKPWRDRFGAEFAELIATERLGFVAFLDIVRAAATERLFNPSGVGDIVVETYPSSVIALSRKPSGYVPIVMSLAALAVVLGAVAMGHARNGGDEGAAAHMFQLLVVAQVPLSIFFAIRWFRRDARATVSVLGFQAIAIGIALLPVWAFGL